VANVVGRPADTKYSLVYLGSWTGE
jgi:hypothetical protein